MSIFATRPRDATGLVEERQAKRAAFSAMMPSRAPAKAKPLPPLKAHAVYERGRYVPPTLIGIINVVASASGLSFEGICGFPKKSAYVDARFCIAVLAEEFSPRHALAQVDDAMSRGTGMCDWYRSRHSDRLKDSVKYANLYWHCREVMATKALRTPT